MATPLPGGGLVRLSLDTETSSSRASTALGQDVLSVTAGEPDTHINLETKLGSATAETTQLNEAVVTYGSVTF